jgi:hypothetical protein
MISTLKRNVRGRLNRLFHPDEYRAAPPKNEEASTDRFKKGSGDGDPGGGGVVKNVDPPSH